MRVIAIAVTAILTLALVPASVQAGEGQETQYYVVTADEATMWGFGIVSAEYNGIPCYKITAERMEILRMYQSGFELTASRFYGEQVTVYATYADAGDVSWTDTCVTLLGVEMHVLALEGSNVVIDNYLSVTFPVEITQTASSVTMSGYNIVGFTYEGTRVTKITARSLGAKGMSMSVGTYRLQAPDLSMQNAAIYATYVSGRALGLIPLRWSGSSVPWLVSLAKIIMPTISMTNVTMRAVYIQASRVTIPRLSQSVS